MRSIRVLLIAIFLLAPGVVLPLVWPLAGLGAGEDDVLYYLPARWFFHDCVQRGEWPWINPFTGLGRPFLADPQSAVFYPFTWLFAWLPPVFAYGLHVWLHHSLAAWGMYRLLRAEFRSDGTSGGAGLAAALFGAVAFAYCGFFLAHRVHLTIHAGAAWAPWVFWRMRRYAEQPTAVCFLSAAAAAALQTLSGHVQIAALTALGSLVWLIARSRGTDRPPHVASSSADAKTALPPGGAGSWIRIMSRCVVAWGLIWSMAAALCAVQVLPTLEYVRDCDRGDRDYFAFTENSWHPLSAATFLSPLMFGNRTENALVPPYWGPSHQCEQLGYLGMVPLWMACFGLMGVWRRFWPGAGWASLLLFAFLLGLGRYGPVCPLLYLIPGANVFRVPARALLLADLALCALAARCFYQLLAVPLSPRIARAIEMVQSITGGLLWLVAACTAVVVFAAMLTYATERPEQLSLLREVIFTVPQLVALGLMLLAIRTCGWLVEQRIRHETSGGVRLWRVAVVVIALTAADLGWLGLHVDIPRGVQTAACYLESEDRTAIVTEIKREQKAAGPWHQPRLWVVNWRKGDRFGEYERPWSKLCADTNAIAGIPALNDYGPLQPRVFSRRFAFAPWGYTPLADELLAETDWMAAVNVGWVLLCDVERRTPANGELRLVTKRGYRLYRMQLCESSGVERTAIGAALHSASEMRYSRVYMPRVSDDGELAARDEAFSGPSIVSSGWRRLAVPITDADLAAFDAGLEAWEYEPPGLKRGALASGVAAGGLLAVSVLARMRRALRAPAARLVE